MMKTYICYVLLLYNMAIHAVVLQKESVPHSLGHLQLVSVDNGTATLEFKVFPEGQDSAGLVMPLSTLTFSTKNNTKPVELTGNKPLVISCVKGSFLPVYIQDNGIVSGSVLEGYHGPYYVSMWLGQPHVPDSSKLHIRYIVKQGKKGRFGVKIGQKGDYRLVALQDLKFLHEEAIAD